ncbi:hypothetical protein [Streptomyces sp. NPDC088746]|uniref:hypothetical protein n=1 Tax=Streptomyces sp. NPDC088746 TaxID=3365885 RepID=UPI0038187BE0
MKQSHRTVLVRTHVRTRRVVTSVTAALALCLLGAGTAAADGGAAPGPDATALCCDVPFGPAIGLIEDLLGEIVIDTGDVHDWG